MKVEALGTQEWGEKRHVFWSLENDVWGILFMPPKRVQVRKSHRGDTWSDTAIEDPHYFYVVRGDRHQNKYRRMRPPSNDRYLEWPHDKPGDVRKLVEAWRRLGWAHSSIRVD